MPTAKEIAEALRTAKTLDETTLADLYDYRDALRATGARDVLPSAVIRAANDLNDAMSTMLRQVAREEQERKRTIIDFAEHGVAMTGNHSDLIMQNNHESIVYHAVYRAKREAFHAMLDVFEAIGDRIVATPEEQAKAAADKAEREATARGAAIEAWCKLSATALAAKATEYGIAPGSMHKRTVAILLVDAGHRP